MNKKKDLGQFNTTKKNYILNGFEWIADDKNWIDPFAGDGDLLEWVSHHGAKNVKGYDIDETKSFEVRDTLLSPPDYRGKWVIANPPYLAMNKNKDKTIYQKYGFDDLYKVAIRTVCDKKMGCEGGIFIVPLNFLSSENSSIRKYFFYRYKIISCTVFEERVFEDTDYTVCAFCFEKIKEYKNKDEVKLRFMPSNLQMNFGISEKYGWIFGEEFYKWIEGISTKGIGRWTVDNYKGPEPHAQNPNKPLGEGSVEMELMPIVINDLKEEKRHELCDTKIKENIIIIRSIDTGTPDGRIKLQNINDFGIKCLVGLKTSRNFASVRFNNPPEIEVQEGVIKAVNRKIEEFRKKYNSVFLTAFRNSTEHYSRKRIGFDMVYKMIKKSLGILD